MTYSSVKDACLALGAQLLQIQLKNTDTPNSAGTFLSPASISYALVLALNGATTGSATHSELLQLLLGPASSSTHGIPAAATGHGPFLPNGESGLNQELGRVMQLLSTVFADAAVAGAAAGQSSEEQELILAQGIFVRGGDVKPAYAEAMHALFQAEVQRVSCADDVNAWVDGKTRGIIPQLLEPGTPFSTVLANALYFKGRWQSPFKAERSSSRPFTALTGQQRSVHMMQRMFENQDRLQVLECPGVFRAAWLPYRGMQLRALVCLPDAPGADGVVSTLRALADPDTGAPHVTKHPSRVDLSMPKFKVDSCMSLKDSLQQLGVVGAFDPDRASFARLSEEPQFVSDVIHKAVVDVDESGTVAAAATAVVMLRCCAVIPDAEPPYELHCDRPFVFLIQHVPTGVPLFMGVVGEGQSADARP